MCAVTGFKCVHIGNVLLFVTSIHWFKPLLHEAVISPLTAKLFNLNFHPLEVVSR